MPTTSVLKIEEQSGRRRAIELKGSGLPLQGVEFGGSTVLATSWNPGNAEATQHVLGPQEIPSTLSGVWRTTQLVRTPCSYSEQGSTKAVTFAYSLANILSEFQRSGQSLLVTWFNCITSGTPNTITFTKREQLITRIGRLSEFKPKYDRIDDIEWNATFVWTGRGVPPAKLVDDAEDVVAKLRAANIAASQAATKIASDEFLGSRQTRLFPNQLTLGQLEAMADAPREMVDSFATTANGISNRLKRVGDLIIKIRETPAAILGRILDVANNAVGVSNQFIDELSREGPETLSASNKVSSLTQSVRYYSGAQTLAESIRDANNDLARTVRRRRNASDVSGSVAGGSDALSNDILAVYIPRQGDTFVSIAIKYYQTETYGPVLARMNGYPSYTVEPPRKRPVIIPSVRNIEAQATSRV